MFLDELAAFPHGSHDDLVDGLSAAYAYLAQKDEVPIVAPVGFTRQSRWHFPSVTDGWPWP